MATLTIRNLPEAVRQSLRQRAALNGRSMEAEVRDILCRTADQAPGAALGTGLSPQAAAALARLRKAFAPRPGEPAESLVDEFLKERPALWGDK